MCGRILRKEGKREKEEEEGEAHDSRLCQNISEMEKSCLRVMHTVYQHN